jgi:hypothetical protein
MPLAINAVGLQKLRGIMDYPHKFSEREHIQLDRGYRLPEGMVAFRISSQTAQIQGKRKVAIAKKALCGLFGENFGTLFGKAEPEKIELTDRVSGLISLETGKVSKLARSIKVKAFIGRNFPETTIRFSERFPQVSNRGLTSQAVKSLEKHLATWQ